MCAVLIIIGIVVIIVVIVLASQQPQEGFQYAEIPYGIYGSVLEQNEACRWDTARKCTRSDGTEGNCVLGGFCAPSFYADPCC